MRETIKRQTSEEKGDKFIEKIVLGEMSDNEKEVFMRLISEYKDIFEYDKEKIGKVEGVKHKIKIMKIRNRYYKEDIRKHQIKRDL
jgi:hypothetical protein